ncbi:hypothetical protein ACH5RR_018305 [Cinchona calisaya]|uniref:HSF-type DNA-binding domain-containing protein n=1 Tax=Cinchona calisaya TaxID=153742 RepID=A0ABD2ZL66_9GENT
MEGKRKEADDTGGNGDSGASTYNVNSISVGRLSMRGRARSFPPPFLMKTFEIVEDPKTNSIISWSSNNTSFIIWDQVRFTTELLPKHFRHNNFSSFVYQLNNYGFKKISWEKSEYENPWFQAGKRHLLENIKRRNQLFEYETMTKQPSYGSSDDLMKDILEEQIEKLMIEQHGLKVEVQNLNQQQKEMQINFSRIKDSIKVVEIKKKEMASQLLVEHFIQKLREKREISRNETNKKQKIDNFGRKEISLVLMDKRDSFGGHKDQVQDELLKIQRERQTFSSLNNFGSSNQKENTTRTSKHAENCDFWKNMMEDVSECENEKIEHYPKVSVKLEDLIASNTLMEERCLDKKDLARYVEEEFTRNNVTVIVDDGYGYKVEGDYAWEPVSRDGD